MTDGALGGQGQYVIMLGGRGPCVIILNCQGPYIIMISCQGQYVVMLSGQRSAVSGQGQHVIKPEHCPPPVVARLFDIC